MSYGGDVNRGPFLNAIDWVFTSIALAFVVLRLLSQNSRKEKRRWGIDEALIIFPIAVILVRSIYISYCIHIGFGKHLVALLEVDPVQTIKLTRLLVILEAISLWTWALPKLPIAILLYRVFGTYNRKLGFILFLLVGFLLTVVIVQTIITFVKCTPIEKNWNPTGVAGKCWPDAVYYDIGYFVGALDFGFAIYAITQVFRLQMDHSRKIMIAISLSLGIPYAMHLPPTTLFEGLAGIVTCIKLSAIGTLDYADITYSTVSLEVWNSVESCALVVAASVPSIRSMFIMMGTRIKEWATLFSTRETGNNSKSAKKQSEVSNGDSFGKRRVQTQSVQLENFREIDEEPLFDRPTGFRTVG